MKKAAMLLAVAGFAFAGVCQAEEVKFQVKGAYCAGCVKALTKTLTGVSGVKLEESLKPAKTEAQMLSIDLDTSKSDVGDVAKAIAETKTPHAKLAPPGAALIVSVKGVTKADTEKVRKALHDVKGVSAKESSAGAGEVVVGLDHSGDAKLSEITKALKKVAE
jgi:copper chaperone CopZ